MYARAEAMRHSPALWGLLWAIGGEVALVVAWNAYDRRADLARLCKALIN